MSVKESDIQTLNFVPTKYDYDTNGNPVGVRYNTFQFPAGIVWKDIVAMEVRRGVNSFFAKLASGTSSRLLIQGSDFNTYTIADNATEVQVGGSMAYSKTDFTGRIIVKL